MNASFALTALPRSATVFAASNLAATAALAALLGLASWWVPPPAAPAAGALTCSLGYKTAGRGQTLVVNHRAALLPRGTLVLWQSDTGAPTDARLLLLNEDLARGESVLHPVPWAASASRCTATVWAGPSPSAGVGDLGP
jgi:hypothetical protein